jgi:hypothetical protein
MLIICVKPAHDFRE